MADRDIAALRFLLVDDEPFILNLTEKILRKSGAQTVEKSSNASEALDLLSRTADEFDVVMCDLNMPEMDGIEFLRHLSVQTYSGAVVLVSGEDARILKSAQELAQAHRLDILGAVSKPISPAALVEVLGRYETPKGTATHADADAETITRKELRKGIDRDQLTVFFQPKVSVTGRKVVGVEGLVRWQHPSRGMIPPGLFIPVSERHGLIDAVTEVVFAKALHQGAAWLVDGLDLDVSLNLSVDSLTRLDLPETVVGQAEAEGMAPRKVTLEVTESGLMQDIKTPLEILNRLRLKGIGLSIDDFGTGYSTLEQLKRVPFTELKVDRAFVHGASRDAEARAILESSVDLGKKLNMKIVAEGVEDQEDWDLVADLGCDLVQGYFVAKPMPGEEIADWVGGYLAAKE